MRPAGQRPSRYDGRGLLGPGITALYLGLLVLIPIAALLWRSIVGRARRVPRRHHQPGGDGGPPAHVLVSLARRRHQRRHGHRSSPGSSCVTTSRARRVVNALIDLPFALPTIVAGLTLLTLYGPRSPFGINVAYSQAGIMRGAPVHHAARSSSARCSPCSPSSTARWRRPAPPSGASHAHGRAPHRPAQPRARHPDGLGARLRPQHRRVRLGRAHRRATSRTGRSSPRSTSSARSRLTTPARRRPCRSCCWSPRSCC